MKISVIVTNHKGTEPYLGECLESLFAQTLYPDEIIVVSDGYDKPIIHPGVTLIIRDKNIGLAQSREQGMRIMTGTHVLFVDGDDVLPPNYIQEMVTTLETKKSDIVYPNILIWQRWGTDKAKPNGYISPPEVVSIKQMMVKNYILVTSLMKKEVYETLGGFDRDLILFEDWEFFLRAMHKGFKVHKADTFLYYRQRASSRNRANSEQKDRITIAIRNRFKTNLPLSQK